MFRTCIVSYQEGLMKLWHTLSYHYKYDIFSHWALSPSWLPFPFPNVNACWGCKLRFGPIFYLFLGLWNNIHFCTNIYLVVLNLYFNFRRVCLWSMRQSVEVEGKFRLPQADAHRRNGLQVTLDYLLIEQCKTPERKYSELITPKRCNFGGLPTRLICNFLPFSFSP